ncbi:phage minor tail protein G [Rouxiella badensis]|uniref:phage tail assembly chaperone G n=1 Tax=Rouxiella badensis TaxID=1646377 RepID=UPI000363DE37|nr:phage minor tail protein G [Rouxiella badensis]MCC3749705.1 phage minor tail protein G [Rouxiella badensis]
MFLKSESFTFNGETVTLFELSALQRIEYLKYLSKEVAASQEEVKEAAILQAELVEKTIRDSAMLLAMSLWHNDIKGPSVQDLNDTVLSSWPVTAIGEADYRVKKLSGLIQEATSESEAGSETEILPAPVEKS